MLNINNRITSPGKVDEILEAAVDAIQDGSGLSTGAVRAPFLAAQECLATWWPSRPAVSEYIGLIFFKDIGLGGSYWYSDGFSLNPCHPIIIYSATNLLCPADTNLNIMFRKHIFGDLLGTDRELVFDGLFSFTNSGNAKTLSLAAGSFSSPTVIGTTAPTANASINFTHKWGNTGATNAQAFFPSLSSPFSITSSAMSTSTVDTSAPFYISASLQLANAADTAKINRLTVTLR